MLSCLKSIIGVIKFKCDKETFSEIIQDNTSPYQRDIEKKFGKVQGQILHLVAQVNRKIDANFEALN